MFLFDNSEDDGQQSKFVSDFIEDGFLTWLVLDGPAYQVGAYQYCATHYANSYSWVLQFDLDEFVVLSHKSDHRLEPPLKALMRQYRFYPGKQN